MVSKSQRHRDAVLECIAKMDGITEDVYGNFIRPDGNRYHPNKTALNKQFKSIRGWKNIWTAYFKDIEMTDDGKIKVLKKF